VTALRNTGADCESGPKS